MDIRQFHSTFFEESRDNLRALENGLLDLESGRADAETIHVVFRAAHSIKGGAATFGFTSITALTHLLETLLDQARSGKRVLDSEAISALLGAVDVLASLLAAAEHGQSVDEPALAQAHARLEHILAIAVAATGDSTSPPAAPDHVPGPADVAQPWRIRFQPKPGMFLSGNDPLRILRELATLGEMQVELLDGPIPAFAHLDVEQAHLGWQLALAGHVTRSAIDDVFAWVEDDCELSIERTRPVSTALEAITTDPASPTPDPFAHAGRRASDHDNSIRVAVTKVDALINLVGELVITQAMLQQRSDGLDPMIHDALLAGLEQLQRNTRDLQEAVMGVRMLPVEFAFSRLPRMVRDLAARLGKQVDLRTSGEATELDKGVIEKIVDPLVHLVRNAIDHGLETPAERLAAGKPGNGTLLLSAAHQGGHIVIRISDDGRGLDRDRILRKAQERGMPLPEAATDEQVWDLIFQPGFSTAEALTDLSGRGVGMDVVRKNIAALGGQVEIRSQAGTGTTVTIRLPLTLAILDGMSVAVCDEVFILPLNAVVESLQPQAGDIRTIANQARVLRVRDQYLPLLDLAKFFGVAGDAHSPSGNPIAVVVEGAAGRMALQVDDLLGQQQVVVKNLETNYRRVAGVSGATILGDGRVALIVDTAGLSSGEPLPVAA